MDAARQRAASFSPMQSVSTVVIALLSAVVIYIGKKWLDTRTENAELRSTVASLKRRLKLAAR